MRYSFFTSLRGRLLVLILSAVLPVLGWALYTGLEERSIQRSQVEENALRLTRLAAGDVVQAVEGARQLLIGLAQLPEVRPGRPAVCSDLFSSLIKKYPSYANLGAVDQNGNLFCSARPVTDRINVSDNDYFRRLLSSNDFMMSDYRVDEVTGDAVITFGYPVYDSMSTTTAVVFANLDLAWFKQLAIEARLPKDATLAVVDSSGLILARYPDPKRWIGKRLPEELLSQTLRPGFEETTVEADGMDGIPRLYGITRVGGASDSKLLVSIGISKKDALAPVNRVFTRNLIGIALLGALALTATWFGGEIIILRRLESLVNATKRLARGDLSARIGPPYEGDEINMLARSFDEMADALERRTTDLNRAEARYRTLVEQIPMITYITPLDKTAGILYISPQVEAITGFSQEEWLADPQLWARQLHPDDREALLNRLLGKSEAEFAKGFRIEYRMLSKRNRELWFRDEAVAVGNEPDRPPFLQGILIDITEQKRVEEELKASGEQLRDLAAHIEAVREGERTRIAREIHDELGQALTGLKMDISWLGKRLDERKSGGTIEPLQEKIDSMKRLIDATVQSVRKISTELRPGILDDLGLVPAIEWQASDFESRTGIQCVLSAKVPDDLPLDEKRSSAIFRIFQEVLTNVARHAMASRVEISLTRQNDHLVLEVLDNGRGVTEGESYSSKSLGILGMRERTLLLGGEFNVKGVRGQGTLVTVRVPLAAVT